MSKHAAKILSAFAVALVAGTALAPNAVRAAPAETAAVDCLAAPSGPAPKGGHWFYKLDRATKQKCWYVKNVGKQPALAAAEQDPAAEAEPPAMQPSVADARAELPPRQQPAPMQPAPAPLAQAEPAPLPSFQAPIAPQANAQPAAPQQAAAVPSKDTARWTQASRWTDQESATTGAATSDAAAAKPAAAPAAVAPVAEASMFDLAGIDSSLWMMLGALAGALALVGLAVGAAIRLSRPVQIERDRFIDAPLPWDAEVEDRPQPVFGTRR